MFKKKNKMLLTSAILIALGGANAASAAVIDEAFCKNLPVTTNTLDLGECSIIFEDDLNGLASLAFQISENETLSINSATVMADPLRPNIAKKATAIYLDIMTQHTNLPAKKIACDSTARVLIERDDIMILAGPETATSSINDLLEAAVHICPEQFDNATGNLKDLVEKLKKPEPVGDDQVKISRDNLGEVLIYPYYTTRDGKESLINVFNTSDQTIATKVRLHESHNSRDVLDFTVVLSPYDKWSGVIKDTGDGPTLHTSDSSCTVPAFKNGKVKLNSQAYTGVGLPAKEAMAVNDGGDQTEDRLKEGYVEIFAMGQATAGKPVTITDPKDPNKSIYVYDIAANAEHLKNTPNDGETTPRDCGAVIKGFAPNEEAYNLAKNIKDGDITGSEAVKLFQFIQSGRPQAEKEFDKVKNNPLRGALVIIDKAKGVGFGVSAVALTDFNDTDENLITAQSSPFFHEPSIASRNGIWTTTGLMDVENAIRAKRVINEWASNTRNGAHTDWVLQFPTKGFHVDCGTDGDPDDDDAIPAYLNSLNYQSARNIYRKNYDTCGKKGGYAPFEKRFNGTSPITIKFDIYDKEENWIDNTYTPGVSFSPSENGGSSIVLPYETNVITFSGIDDSRISVLSSKANSPQLKLDPVESYGDDGKYLTENNGMAIVSFVKATQGLPVLGFMAKERNQGDATRAYGQIIKHSYKRAK